MRAQDGQLPLPTHAKLPKPFKAANFEQDTNMYQFQEIYHLESNR